MAYEVIKMDEQTWRIEDSGIVRCFLLTGDEMALMIDTGMMLPNALEIAKELTDLPIELIVTHGDPDHVSGNGAFDYFYMNPAEASNYYNTQGKAGNFVPAEDGDVFDLGNRSLQVISVPGHTPGSIALLDLGNQVLYAGDTVQEGPIFMFGVQRELHAFIQSLEKLAMLKPYMTTIYPSHGSFPLEVDMIDRVHDAAVELLAGNSTGFPADVHGNQVMLHDINGIKFFVQ